MATIECPHCGQSQSAQHPEGGRSIVCSRCRAEFHVSVKTSDWGSAPSRTGSGTSRSSTGRWLFLAFPMAAILAVIAVILARALFPKWNPVTPQSTDSVQVTYDRLKDKSQVSVGGIDDANWRLAISSGDGKYVNPEPNSQFGVYLGFEYPFAGTIINRRPESIVLTLGELEESDLNEIGMPSDSIYLLVNGQRTSYQVLAAGSHSASAIVPTTLVVSMATAQSVEIEAGNGKYKLTPQQIRELHEFIQVLGIEIRQ
jgi:hypothetical protein